MVIGPLGAAGLVLVGFMAGTIAHEGGHFLVATAMQLHPRVVTIGCGPTAAHFRVGKTDMVLRLLPLGGSVQLLPAETKRRAALAAFALGGVLGNATLFALLAAISATDRRLSAWLALIAVVQLVMTLINLIPFSFKRNGFPVRSDGLFLVSTLFGRGMPTLADCQAALLHSLGPLNGAMPSVSSFTAEIVHQASRRDRFNEEWACRDASAALRRLLTRPDLGRAERAIVLDLLVENEMLAGDSGASDADLDGWSSEASSLFESPALQVSRGSTLAALGRPADARAMLRMALSHELHPLNAAVGRPALSRAIQARGDTEAATRLEREAWMAIQDSTDPMIHHAMTRLARRLDRTARLGG